MTDRARRRELTAAYLQEPRDAGVYAIRNQLTGRAFVGASLDLASVRNKLAFAKATNTPSAFDWPLGEDMRRHGPEAYSLEVLEVLDVRPGMSAREVQVDLAALEELWREKLGEASDD